MAKKEKIYIAGPFSTFREKSSLQKMISLVRKNFPDAELYIPMDYKVPGEHQNPDGTWALKNYDWARQVYLNDLANLDSATKVFAMYAGRDSTTGTAWEIGYACALGIDTYLYIPGWASRNDMSLMVLNSPLGYIEDDGEIHYVHYNFLERFNQK